MTFSDWILLAAGIAFVAVGLYIRAEPRRLFVREDERTEYRPGTVEYESAQGRSLRRMVPVYIAAGVIMAIAAFL